MSCGQKALRRPPAPIAAYALTRIGGLYAAEADIRGRSAEARRSALQERSRPVIEALEPWLHARLETVSQKGKLAEAIRYALSRWEGLARFLDDGRIELDSNTVARAFHPSALTRKNSPFAGSDGGGEHWAVLAALIETCKLNDAAQLHPRPPSLLTDAARRRARRREPGADRQPVRPRKATGVCGRRRSDFSWKTVRSAPSQKLHRAGKLRSCCCRGAMTR